MNTARLAVLEHLLTNDISSLSGIGIKARWSTVNPRKVTLNYDQIECVDGHPIVNECRGLVLRQDHDGERGAAGAYSVMARTFPRFYNLGAPHAAAIDWTTAEFEEKLDGTLCIAYFDADIDRWCVATRGVPDADVPTVTGETFADLFGRQMGALPAPWWRRGWTYCYELTGPGNQIVVPYNEWEATLLGAYECATGQHTRGWARRFRFASASDARAWLDAQPGTVIEGLIVVDGNNSRVKVKNAQYLAAAKVMTASGTDVGLLDVILSGSADDVRPWLPLPRQERLDALAAGVREWAAEVNALSATLRQDCPNRKAAAMAVQSSWLRDWMGPLMDGWSGKQPDAAAWLADARKRSAATTEKMASWLASR